MTSLHLPFPVSLTETVKSHGWVQLSPWNWDEEKETLSRPQTIDAHKHFTIRIAQKELNSISVILDDETIKKNNVAEIYRIVKRWLSCGWEPTDAVAVAKTQNPQIAEFIKRGGGRFLRSSTFYEDLVKTLCTVNTNWASTKTMVAGLVNFVGNGIFPTPIMVNSQTEKALRENCRMGFRASTLLHITDELLRRRVIDQNGNVIEKTPTYHDLLKLKGIGPYSASHISMLENDFSRIPIDSVVTNLCKNVYRIDPKAIESHYSEWGDYKFLGYNLGKYLGGLEL